MDNGVIEAWKNADKKMMRNPILVGALNQNEAYSIDFALRRADDELAELLSGAVL